MAETSGESMLLKLIRQTAHAYAYARLYGQKPEDGSEIGRNEAWARMTAADVFEAIDIITRTPGDPT